MIIRYFIRLSVWCIITTGIIVNPDSISIAGTPGDPNHQSQRLEDVLYEHMESGIIYIKLSGIYSKEHHESQVSITKSGIVHFGLNGIDHLNSRFGVSNFNPLFSGPLINKSNDARHRDHGLHLWYALKIPESHDIKAVVKAYNNLPEVEIAEPVYTIKHTDASVRVPKRNPGRTFFPDRTSASVRTASVPTTNQNHPSPYYNEKTSAQVQSQSYFRKNDPEPWIPNDPQISSQSWHYTMIELYKAWTIERGNNQVIVSVHDSGIAFDHPDLSGAMWPQIGPAGTATKAEDHGTHVAGTIGAVTNNGIGVAGIAGGDGPSGGVRLMSVDIFNDENITTFQGYVYAADFGVPISQNSWSYENADSFNRADLNGIDYFVTNGGGNIMDGGIVIFAAGNSNTDEEWYPGFYNKTLAVASTNSNDNKSDFSNFGPWVDISAPGSGVYSTTTNNGYASLSGTSMACPHVSGVAALVLSYVPGMLAADQLKEILVLSADDISLKNPNYIDQLGSGRVNAYKALQLARNYAVLNPENILAININSLEIQLSWNLNINSDTVVIAYNTSGIFVRPDSVVNIGDEISPGTFVLYKGTNTDWLHQGLLNGTRYYYNIWSYDGERYSRGFFTYADTECGLLRIPYLQNFKEQRMPNCWQSYSNPGGHPNQVWEVGRISFGGLNTSDFTANYAYIDSDIFGEGSNQDTDLRSPNYDLSNMENAFLSFTHYYRHRSGSKASVWYSLDDGESWNLIQEWLASTSNPDEFLIEVPEIAGKPNVTLKWNYKGSDSYYWSINNINLLHNVSANNQIPVAGNIRVYPNPSQSGNSAKIQFPSGLSGLAELKVFSQTGALVASYQINLTDYHDQHFQLPVFTAGIYLADVVTNNKRFTVKYIISP